MIRYSVVVLLAALSGACALTSRSEPIPMRYFSADASQRSAPSVRGDLSGLSLRLERVRSSSHLGEPIAYRTSEHELGYYDEERWTEQPEAFLERGLERALFQERRVTRVMGGASESLAVELVAFEEVRGPQPIARVEAIVTLHDERAAHLEQTIRVERPISTEAGKDPTLRTVAALSAALDTAVEQIADLVSQRLQVLAAKEPAAAAEPSSAAAAVR
ncbi:MAG TPA: ABC-type transport auxiliary lipoprotein family protein [Polyangiales bacterium]|nr:ABC-type transport auxiliary lipoprotein family protein [Polyangiales bacterium]